MNEAVTRVLEEGYGLEWLTEKPAVGRRGLVLITVWEKPEMRAAFVAKAKRMHVPLSHVIRRLLRDWMVD